MAWDVTGAPRRVAARRGWDLPAIVAVTFTAMVAYRLALGEQAFTTHGYLFYREFAESFLRGDGFCSEGGGDCAMRVPVYPLVMSAFIRWDWLYPGLPILQAALGASCCLIAYGIGRTLFDRRAGLLAAGLVAVNPYSIIHSTAMQETSLFNLLIALAIYLLLKSREPGHGLAWSVGAGVTLMAATLTSMRLVLLLPLTVLWVALPPARGARWRLREAVLVLIPVALLLGGWLARNQAVVGAPVLSTESGVNLWLANHPVTADFLPDRSVDEIFAAAHERLPEPRKAMLAASGEVAASRLLTGWALEYMREHPGPALVTMLEKVTASFSGQLSPARDWLSELGYAAYAVPLNVLALIGGWRARHNGQRMAHLLVGLLFVAFVITTAIFWAHTSHQSTLHVFLAVYAAFALTRWWPRPVTAG